MKLVVDFITVKRANKFSRVLRRQGIASFVGISRVGNTRSRLGVGQKTYGVWVLVESQHSEAIEIADGKDVKVTSPLTDHEIANLEREVIRRDNSGILKEILVFIALSVVVVGVLYLAS